MLLVDKVCMVVGAGSSRGIGHATAALFLRHGAKVVVADIAMEARIAAELVRASGRTTDIPPRVHAVRCDIQSADDCDRCIDETVREFGTLDVLVNCAGVVQAQPMLSISETDYDRILDINLKGTFNVCRSALRVLAAKRSGAIVNLASVAAQRGGGLIGGAHYAASKGGVISLTKSIAREFGPLGIRANAICPSMVETGMLDGNISADTFAEIVASIPLQRAGRPTDIAGACLFLASDLSAYITGATIDVNGGSHIH